MEKFVSLVISGAVSGAIYSIIASGLVLAFATSRVFNFAHGAIAFTSAYLYYELNVGLGWPILPSAIVAIVVWPVLLGLLLDRALFRNLAKANDATRIVATVGLMLALPSLALWLVDRFIAWFDWNIPNGSNVYVAPGLGPSPKKSWNVIGRTVIDSNQVIVFVAAAVSAVVLWYVLRRTRLGLEMRATVDRRELASIRGIDPGRTSSMAWALSMMLAGLAGVVGAPIFGLSVDQYTLVLFVAATAVVLGGMRSIPISFAGGLLIGVIQNLAAGYPPDFLADLPGVRASVPPVLLLVALLVLGRSRVRVAGSSSSELVPPPDYLSDLPRWRRTLPWAVVVGFLIVFVLFIADRYWQGLIAKGFGLGLIFLSIVVLTGIGGMVSLAQATFVASGAMTAGLLFSHDVPFLVALAAGTIVATVAGMIVGAIGVRLGGLPLALATLALALFGDQLVFQLDSIRGGPSGWRMPRPDLGFVDFHDDGAMAMLMLVCVGLGVLLVSNLQRSATGRAMIAVRSSEPAAETSGISAVMSRLIIFGLSAGLAGAGGVVLSSFEGRVSNASYITAEGLIWLAIVVTFGVRRPGAAFLGGITFSISPEVVGWITTSGRIPTILFGLGAVNLARNPDGSMAQIIEKNHQRRKARRLRREARLATETAATTTAAEAVPDDGIPAGTPPPEPIHAGAHSVVDPARSALRLTEVSAGYGDVGVLYDVSFDLEKGSVTALLGVNGAGKSTLCRVMSGLLTPTAGTIEVLGSVVTAQTAHKRVASGLVLAPEGRGIFPGLTVEENLAVWLPGGDEREETYDRFPQLANRRDIVAGKLSGGEQQILTLAPLLIRRPAVLVADEPTLGLAPLVIEQLFGLFGELRDDGVTILLAEEKARDVLNIADRVIYLHLGHVLWDVPRSEVGDALLEAAYLGTAAPASR